MEAELRQQTEAAALQLGLRRLLQTPGLTVDRIAALLDAEQYVTSIQRGRGNQPVRRFDVQRYTADRIASGVFPQLPDEYHRIDDVILEPSKGGIQRGGGSGMENPGIIHRTKCVMDLLRQMKQRYAMIDGKNRKNMVRRLSYVIFILTEARKLLFVCDEENNATFLVHYFKHNQEWKSYKKEEMREMAKIHPEFLSVIDFDQGMEAYIKKLEALIRREYIPQEPVEPSALKKTAEYEPAPPGWLTIGGLSGILEKSRSWVSATINAMHLIEGTEYGTYLDGAKNPNTHYSPAVGERLEKIKSKE